MRELTENSFGLHQTSPGRPTGSLPPARMTLSLFCDIADEMTNFKWLMDTAKPGDMERLCEQFKGFHTYAKLLEKIAQGIASGEIPAK